MEIKFKIQDFQNQKPWLMSILNSLRIKNKFERTKETDEFFCTSPALAYKYVRTLVVDYRGWNRKLEKAVYKNILKNRLTPEQEKVFSRSLKYSLKYLIITSQKSFRDKKLNEKFLNKIYNNPLYSFVYARNILGKRIPKEKEVVFLRDYEALYHYAKLIIKGKFDHEIQNRILMLSFSEEEKKKRDFRYLEFYMDNIENPDDNTGVSRYYGKYI